MGDWFLCDLDTLIEMVHSLFIYLFIPFIYFVYLFYCFFCCCFTYYFLLILLLFYLIPCFYCFVCGCGSSVLLLIVTILFIWLFIYLFFAVITLLLLDLLAHSVSNLCYCFGDVYDLALVFVVWQLFLLVCNFPYDEFIAV